MSSTLAADDRTVIPFYAGIQVYYTHDYEHTTNATDEYKHMNMILNVMTPPLAGIFLSTKS